MIELSIVVLISGLLLASTVDFYAIYLQNYHYHSTIDKLNTIYSSINNYSSSTGRLPYPSDPSLPISSPDSGCECGSCTPATQVTNCAQLVAMATGVCMAGICKVPGFRHTPVNPNAGNDPIYIGGVPYRTIKGGISHTSFNDVSMMNTLDDWNFQIGYAVSSASVSGTTFGQGVYGVIRVTTENGVDLTSPAGSANFILISYGDNHMGAYTADGVINNACIAGTMDFANCSQTSTFISGLRSMGAGAAYFDDVVKYSSFGLTELWDFTTPGSQDIHNLNVGSIGIGTSTPGQKLEVAGDISSDSVTATNICDNTGANCWRPNLLAGPATGSNASGNKCPAATAGNVQVVTSMVNGVVQCTQIPLIAAPTNQNCPPGRYAIGFSGTRGLICN